MARSLTVRLAGWSLERKFHRLYWAISQYWVVRNFVQRHTDWLVFHPLITRARFFFTPKCSEHPKMPLAAGLCGLCMLKEAGRTARVAQITGRSRSK